MRSVVIASCLALCSPGVQVVAATAAPAPAPVVATPASMPVPTRGCRQWDLDRIDAIPDKEGPLKLAAVDCIRFRGENSMIVSPDGKAVAAWEKYSPAPIEIAWLGQARVVSLLNFVSFRNLAYYWPDETAADALAWSSGSKFLWSVRQKQVPGGFSASGLAPIRIDLDGTITALPEVHHPAGPLDGLAWVGGSGLAIGMFGGRGYWHRPVREEDAFTLAMIDAAHGRLLEVLPINAVPGLPDLTDKFRVERAAAATLHDGRIASVVQISAWRGGHWWLVWTQGEPPRLWPLPHPREDNHNYMSLSPDGSKLLVLRVLQPQGHYNDCAPGTKPPPLPVTGPIAEYYDLDTRRLIWQTSATVTSSWIQRASPVISPDGRYALIDLPSKDCKRPIGVLDLASGRVVQKVAEVAVNARHYRFGFTNRRSVWLAVGNVVLSYSIE